MNGRAGGGGGGGGEGSVLQIFFSDLRASVWSKNKEGAPDLLYNLTICEIDVIDSYRTVEVDTDGLFIENTRNTPQIANRSDAQQTLGLEVTVLLK